MTVYGKLTMNNITKPIVLKGVVSHAAPVPVYIKMHKIKDDVLSVNLKTSINAYDFNLGKGMLPNLKIPILLTLEMLPEGTVKKMHSIYEDPSKGTPRKKSGAY